MAGNIDNLNFEVILNDKKFETAVKKDIELAKKLNTSLTQVLNLKNKINATSKSAFLDEQRMAREAAKTAAAKAKEALQWQKVRTEAEKTALANQKVKAAIEKSAASLSGSGNSFLRVWLRFSATLWSIISVIRIFTNTIGSAFKKIMDFQQANANLATIMQVSRKEIETLTNDALMLGRTTEWTASQVTELQTALAKLGYNIPQIQNMQASVLQFATAVGANLPEAANLAGAALRMFGMHSTEMQKALEILTASTNKTALDFEKLKTSLPYVGAIAHSIGFDVAETAAMLGVLSNAGLSASRTGTGLRQVLLELSKQNGKLQNAMGGNIKSFDDFVNGLQSMRDRGLEAGEATKLVSTRASSALLILANGVDDIRRLNDEIRDTDGLLKSIQSERLDTLHGSVLLLKSAWEGLIQTFRDSAGPMKDIVDWLTDIVRATSLAASRANRVAQGTSGNDAKRGTSGIIGSDALSNQFKQHFDSLIKNGTSPEEAARIVNKEMNDWLDSAQDHLIELQKHGYKENAWNRFLYDNWIGRIFVGSKMNSGREANEQIEAVENAMGAVTAYMSSRAKEEAEIAANTYLEEWKFVFDTQGEQAARDAMRKVAGFDEIKSRMEAYIANGGEEGASDRGKGNDADDKQRKFISNLKEEAQYLRKLADAYEKLEQYLGEGANAKMVELFGEGDYSRDSIENQVADIVSALRNLGDEGVEAAIELEKAWGLDKFSLLVKQLDKDKKAADDAQKSLEKFLDTIKEWADKNQELSGTGAEFNISKAIGNYKKAVANAEGTAKEAFRNLIYGTTDENSRLIGYAQINAESAKARANALVVLRNDITKYADDIMKEQLSGFDLTDLNDKTLSQINAIKDAIREVKVPEDIKLLLKDYPELLKVLEDELEKLKNDELDNTYNPEIWKKNAKQAKYIAQQFLKVADALKDFGDAAGNEALADTAEKIGAIASLMESTVAGYKTGGPWGALIGGLSELISQVLGGITEAEKKAKEIRDAIIDARVAASSENFKSFLSDGTDSIFGSNTIKGIRNAVDGLTDVEKKMKDLDDWILKFREDAEKYMMFSGGMLYGMLPGGKENTLIRTKGSSFFDATEEYATIEHLAKQFNRDLWDVNGNLNPALLKDILDTYGDLNEELTEWLKNGIEYANEYAEAMKQIEDAAKELVGDVVSDVADKIVDSWWEAGQAALDYADILEDVAKGYAKLVVQDLLMKAAFDDERQKQFMDALKSGDAETAMATVASAMQAAQEMLPTVEQALQVFEPYRNIGGGESNTVGSGIKSITEDTANLLASYINAIRADVSIMRGLQERGWGYIESFGASLPTLNDYIAQIAATNFEIAQSNQSILSEIQSVIGAPGTSGMVVRVDAS